MQGGGEVRIREIQFEGDLMPAIGKGALYLAKKHYIVSSLWIMGLITLSFFKGVVVPDEKLQAYDRVMRRVDTKKMTQLQSDLWYAEDRYQTSKGWFTCDHICQSNKRAMNDAKQAVKKLEKEQEAIRREANSILGIFSTYGVEEAKNSFWKCFKWGKQFGKRQTFWDMLFIGFRSMRRDEGMLEYIFSIMIHFLINMSMGLIAALISFWWSLWGLIRSFQPDFWTGLVFFFGAAIAAGSMVATYLTLLYGTAVGTVVVAVKMIVNANRLEGGGAGRRQNLHYE